MNTLIKYLWIDYTILPFTNVNDNTSRIKRREMEVADNFNGVGSINLKG